MKLIESTGGLDKKHYWQKHVASWRESNLSQVEYCRLNDLSIKSFSYWKRKKRNAALSQPRFFPLVAASSIPIAARASVLQLNIQEKRFSIEIGEDFSPVTLKRLIAILEQL
jgi:hypothetical protein